MDKPFTPTLPMLFQQPGGMLEYDTPGGGGAVSILMRTRDRPILLSRAFASVLGQSFRDWHLVVVNDGGDAATAERLCAAHAADFAGRVTLIHHTERQGMEAASNRALEAAQGEFIVVHDDDDTWHSDFLERTVGFLSRPENAGYIAVVTNGCVVWERLDGERVVEEERQPFAPLGRNIELSRMLAGNSFPPISLLLRRAAALRVGAFNADMPVLGDWEFNLRAMALGDFGFIDETLAYYHKRRDPTDAVYGNSIIAATEEHQRYDVLLRNSIIRVALRSEPSLIGVLQPVLHALREQTAAMDAMHKTIDERINDMRIRLDRIEEHLSEIRVVSLWQRRMLAPVQAVWTRLMPLRRRIDGLFGRAPE